MIYKILHRKLESEQNKLNIGICRITFVKNLVVSHKCKKDGIVIPKKVT